MKEKKFIKNKVVYMNMSGVYDGNEGVLDCRDITGTNCYCDDAAAEEIRKRIQTLPYEGVHFLDSGNYHYLSYFWMEKIDVDFALVLLDHHTDMQPPGFGDILSCGGWIFNARRNLKHLKRVYLVDVAEHLVKELGELPEDVVYVDRQQALDTDFGDLPVYLSIDKDVLSADEVKTDWDQGDMTLPEMLKILDVVVSGDLLGVDICGEIKDNEGIEVTESQRNVNLRLLELFCD
ncbi:MAG: arginase family protein [Lachnospiraceae bacterium]|nr:arginase family protein [Lachnospiraceae bacterium]